jgi:hypothetical protein
MENWPFATTLFGIGKISKGKWRTSSENIKSPKIFSARGKKHTAPVFKRFKWGGGANPDLQ